MNTVIEHEGTITDIGRLIRVQIEQKSACGACSIRQSCVLVESEEKIVEVEGAVGEYAIGERVVVLLEQGSGLKAVFLAYIVPLVLVLLSLVIGLRIFNREYLAGLLALGALMPFYFGLYLMRNKLKSSFRLSLRKQSIPSA